MMNYFKKGLLFGLGITVILCLSIPTIVYASLYLLPNNDIGNYDIIPQGYEFTWLEKDNPSCVELGNQLGTEIVTIQSGWLTIGYENDERKTPIIKKGVKVVFKTLPTSIATNKLDYEYGLSGLQRIGGKSVIDTLIKVDTIK